MAIGWALFPILLAISAIAGIALGWFSGWASASWDQPVTWLYLLGLSPALWVACTAGVGMTTNSWTFAALFGMTCTVTGRVSEYVTTNYLTEGADWFNWSKLAAEVPLALIAGAVFGVAGSAWRHDEGIIRAIGGALIAGVLLWNGWTHIQHDLMSFDLVTERFGWSLVAAAIIVVALSGAVSNVILTAGGTSIIALGLRALLPDNLYLTGPVLSDIYRQFLDVTNAFLDLFPR
jgi:hypothetical protein